MTEKRFTTDNGSHEDVCLVDNLTKKEYESNFEDMVSLMNDIWNQTQRFEKHNQRLEKENEQLKAQLYCDSIEGVCIICKHHYVEKTNMFYISKCEKGHEKCSKESVRHCEDFKLKELQE